MLKVFNLKDITGDITSCLPVPSDDDQLPIEEVRSIINQVIDQGDNALIELTEKFDGYKVANFKVRKDELGRALNAIDPKLREALEKMRDSISEYHRHMLFIPKAYEYQGVVITPLVRPVKRVGIYVPGGRALYPSTVLMCAIPARVAGVEELVLCVPPLKDLSSFNVVMAAAKLAEVDEVYTVGGAQAIAAMAYGTQSINKVDVIVGPGNKYVTAAKRLVAGKVGLPAAYAGPSEVVVMADENANPSYVAMDLIVQAEHGPDGLSWLVSDSGTLIDEVNKIIFTLIEKQPRRSEIISTLEKGGYAVLVDSVQKALDVVNFIAPEHLEIMWKNPQEVAVGVQNAGAVFLGSLSTAAFGDYIAGPSHVLPTFRTARFSAGLTTLDFVRYGHSIDVSAQAIKQLGSYAVTMAQTEGLFAHGESIAIREQDTC
jgi:histidinol dehydrogenase